MASSADYFRMRASHCRKMAEDAQETNIKRIHKELADRYVQQAEAAEHEAAADLKEVTGGSIRRGVNGANR